MGSGVIGSLRVNLGLDSAKFERGARRVQTPLAKMRKQFLGIAAVATAAGAALSVFALKGAKDLDETAKSARRLGASITGFRGLQLAADEAGVSLSSLTSDVQTMNRELASIGVSGNGQRALDALGISLNEIKGLDADEKLALIADQVQKLGLDTGQTTAILRDLGVRNREMVLLVAQGGDALRAARKDMLAYGLAGQAVDDMAPAMERANDQIGRLGLIGKYAAQQLAQEFVPAMGRLAQSMTDSLKNGGSLRKLIDGIAVAMGGLAAVVGGVANNLDVIGVAIMGATVPALAALLASAASAIVTFGFLDVALIAAAASASLATAAMTALSAVVAFLLSPIALAAAAATAAGAAFLIYKNGAGKAETASYDAAEGTKALNVALEEFRVTAGPKAASMAIKVANDNYKLADSAYAAAKAELLKARAMQTAANNAIADDGTGMSIFTYDPGADEKKINSLLANIDRALAALQVASRERKRTDLEVGSALIDTIPEELAAVVISYEDIAVGAASAGSSVSDLADQMDTSQAPLSEYETSIKSISDALAGAIVQGKSLGDAFKSVIAKMVTDLLSSNISALISGIFTGGSGNGGWLSGIFDGIGSLFGFASGGVFSGGAVQAFASGGVVSSPSLFPMSGGKTGLMGEAGPEAIMPLTRVGGKLGVHTDGGTSTVRIELGAGLEGRIVASAVQKSAQQTIQIVQVASQEQQYALGGSVQALTARGTSS